MKNEKYRIGIKHKVFLGFVVLSTILFFSSAIAILEFNRMNSKQSGIIADNINSISSARMLLNISEDYNFSILRALDEDDLESDIIDMSADSFSTRLSEIRNTYTTEREAELADSVMFAYAAYMQVMHESQKIWPEGYETRKEWYFDRLQSFYMKLRGYIQSLTSESQSILAENSQDMEDTFYRSMMPSVAALLAGLVIVLLFNFFINFYFINPLIKMKKGVENYRAYKRDYNLRFDSDDEISDLNKSITELIQDHKSAIRNQ
ncbi:MAG: MCP four helix bundle domain-containing protein [Bacteroidales bacterium]|nr:MCP four helix bundle domain-containing protein [Bacteroidales bacterium]